MIIRKPILTDKNALEKLLIEFDNYTNDYLSPTEKQFMQYKSLEKTVQETVDDYLTNRENLIYVAEDNGMVIRYIVGDVNDRPQRSLDKEGYIRDWFVTEQYRGHHVGKQLFDTLIQEFTKQQCTHLSLTAFVDNTQALTIYHAMGFHDSMTILNKKL